MNEKHSTLKVIYSFVENSLHPTQFACQPNEIISHHHLPWDSILVHLKELSEERLIIFTIPSIITITKAGIDKVTELNTNEVSQEITIIEKIA